MVVDTSVVLALLLREPVAPRLTRALSRATMRVLSTAGLVEAEIAATNRMSEAAAREIDALLDDVDVEVVDFSAEHAALARAGFRAFGKGRHPAALNFGDCFSYALARARGEPLLFVGGDFSRTDVRVAPY
jgi:ribonuclease VapC